MTCNPTPPYYAAFPQFWAMNALVEQQMKLFQMMTELMLKSNPWIIMAESGRIDPLTADAAIGTGDEVEDLNLEAGAAAASPPSGMPGAALKVVEPVAEAPAEAPDAAASVEAQPEAARVAAPEPAPAATPEAKPAAKAPARKRATSTRAKTSAAKSTSTAAKTTAARKTPAAQSRARRKPASPPVMPKGGETPSDKGE